MYDYINDEKLIEDVKLIMKIPELRASLFHKLEEYKTTHGKRIEEVRELENLVDPGKKTGDKEESVKEIRFEIRKKKAAWLVDPVDIPREVVDHIISHGLNPGIIKMQKFKLHGKMVDLSFEMQSRGFITGSITEKSVKTTKTESPSTSKQARKTDNKTEDLKTFIAYLMNNETFCDQMINEFFEHWKPLIDDGFITGEVSEQ